MEVPGWIRLPHVQMVSRVLSSLVFSTRLMSLLFLRVNKNGDFVYVKYHFIADHGQKQFTAEEATRIMGEDPDYSKHDLWLAIEKGERISWTAHVQVMQPEEADPVKLGFDPFDVTKVWPKGKFPVRLSTSALWWS